MRSGGPPEARGSIHRQDRRFPACVRYKSKGAGELHTSSVSVTKFCLCVEYDGASKYRMKNTTSTNSIAERTGSS